MEFPRKEYSTELPFLTLGDLANPGIKPMSFVSPALAGGFFTTSAATWEARVYVCVCGCVCVCVCIHTLIHIYNTYFI